MSAIRPDNKVSTQQMSGCTEVFRCSRHWPWLFPQHGPGRKHLRKIELQPWQRTDKATATRGESAPVAIEVAIALPVS